MVLPFAPHLKPTLIQLVDISEPLHKRIAADPVLMMTLTPHEFERFVLERLSAMGMCPQLVGGGTNRRDGGVDIIFTPPKTFPFPFLAAVQVKHHRDRSTKVGPGPVRDLMGVLATHRLFSAGMIVTNTSFTADARDFATRAPALMRLRDFSDLMRWVADNFVDDAEWREIPRRIQLCEGIFVDVR
jgi:restriction system protein